MYKRQLQRERMTEIEVGCAARDEPTGPFEVGGFVPPPEAERSEEIQSEFSLFS